VVINLGKGRRQTGKTCISLPAPEPLRQSQACTQCSDSVLTAVRIEIPVRGGDMQSKGKGTVHPRTGHEDPKGDYRYSSTLSLTSALDGGWWSKPQPGRFTPGKDPVPMV
jgi:hypothetical protein